MKKFKSKIYKNEKKIKRLERFRKYSDLVHLFTMVPTAVTAFIGFVGIFVGWPFAGIYGGISLGLFVVSLIAFALDIDFSFIEKKIDRKINELKAENQELLKTKLSERIIEKQIKKYRESNYNKQQKKSIENYISVKSKMDRKLKKLNPNLDTEYLGDLEDLGIKF